MQTNLSGFDSNILCYALDPAYPEHTKARDLLERLSQQSQSVAINPTVIHETYHTLAYAQKMPREVVSQRLLLLMRQKFVKFLNQTKSISRNAIYLGDRYRNGRKRFPYSGKLSKQWGDADAHS